jgi:hypothetical protein
VSGKGFISHNLEQDGFQPSKVLIVGDGTMADRSNTLKGPWLRARLGSTTADHALGFTGSESAGNTMNRDTGRKVIKCDERGQRPVGAAAEKQGTSLRAHDGCYSGGLVEGKLEAWEVVWYKGGW